MKNRVIKLVLIIFSFMLCCTNVAADKSRFSYSANDFDECVNQGTCVALCAYENAFPYKQWFDDTTYYYHRSAYITYSLADNEFYIAYQDHDRVVYPSNLIWYNSSNNVLSNLSVSGKCPQYGFVDDAPIQWESEVCFDDDHNYCVNADAGNVGTSFTGQSTLKYDYETHIDTYFTNWVFGDFDCQDFLAGDLKTKISEKINKDFKQNFLNGYPVPSFMANSRSYTTGASKVWQSYEDEFKPKCIQEIQEDETIPEEEKEEQIEQLEEVTEEELIEAVEEAQYKINTSGIGVDPSDDPDCHGLLGKQMTEVINNIFSAVQYCGPVLVAIFTIVDLIKAVASGSQEDMKKAKDKFVKRVIAAALLFFVPLICDMLFSIAGITLPDNCIGK